MARPSRGLNQQVTVKFTAAQVEEFKRKARELDLTLAQLLRDVVTDWHARQTNHQPKGDRPQ